MRRRIDPSLYPVSVRRLADADGGGWLAEAPDLPGCVSDGETPEAAMRNVQDAIVAWIKTARAHGDRVPEPSDPAAYSGQFRLRLPKSLHRRLAEKARTEGVSLNALAMAIIAESLGDAKSSQGGMHAVLSVHAREKYL